MEDDGDELGEDVDEVVKAAIPPGSKKFMRSYFNQLVKPFLTFSTEKDTCS